MSERSFITEKIFHAIIAGCVPIYLGAPNICKFIPKKTFVDLRDFENCIFGSHNASNTTQAVKKTSLKTLEIIYDLLKKV